MPLVLLVAGSARSSRSASPALSVIDRYLLIPSLMLMVLAAVALGGWTMLGPARLAPAWAVGGARARGLRRRLHRDARQPLAVPSNLGFRGDAHRALAAVLDHPRVRAGLKCGPLSVPNHKLVPDSRWLLGARRSAAWSPAARRCQIDARRRPVHATIAALRRIQHGVAIFVIGRRPSFRSDRRPAPADALRRSSSRRAGFRRIAANAYYAAYVRC